MPLIYNLTAVLQRESVAIDSSVVVVSCRGRHVDGANQSVLLQVGLIRHYQSTAALENLIFNHNTIINSMGYHGVLVLGQTGDHISITNNLFVDGFALGADSTDAIRQAEFDEHGETYPNGTARMAWIFNDPDASGDTEWTVENNYYVVTPEGQTFFDQYDPAEGLYGAGSPLSMHIMDQLGEGADGAFTETDLELGDTPDLMVGMMEWYRTPKDQGGAGRTKDTDTFDPTQHDWDRRGWEYFMTDFDASYLTSAEAYTAATGGYPVGDLNWFPDRKAEWENDSAVDVEDDLSGLPTSFQLAQNYPNPFNPTTNISYTLPEMSTVSLVIYNALGQEVERLVDSQQQVAGQYDVAWNGTDQSGNKVATGVYFYQLQVDHASVATKTMILVK